MARKSRISEQTLLEMAQMRSMGLTFKEIGENVGVHETSAFRLIKNAGGYEAILKPVAEQRKRELEASWVSVQQEESSLQGVGASHVLLDDDVTEPTDAEIAESNRITDQMARDGAPEPVVYSQHPQIAVPDFLQVGGWEDMSYRNDTCARSEKYLSKSDRDRDFLVVWVAEEKAEEREYPDRPRFVLAVCLADGEFTAGEGEVLATDDGAEVARVAAAAEEAFRTGGHKGLKAWRKPLLGAVDRQWAEAAEASPITHEEEEAAKGDTPYKAMRPSHKHVDVGAPGFIERVRVAIGEGTPVTDVAADADRIQAAKKTADLVTEQADRAHWKVAGIRKLFTSPKTAYKAAMKVLHAAHPEIAEAFAAKKAAGKTSGPRPGFKAAKGVA